MDDLISRQAAIDIVKGIDSYFVKYVEQLPSAQPNITHIIMETLAECGIYGEEATIKLIGTLKRIGRDDLLPPCAR